MSFWENVKKELDYKGISRKELAFRANIAYQGIGLGIERDSMPRADTAIKISKVLNVPLEYLLDAKDVEIRSGPEKDEKMAKSKNSYDKEEKERNVGLFYKYQNIIESFETLPRSIQEPIANIILRLSESFEPK